MRRGSGEQYSEIEPRDTPHPGCFGKRGCKAIENKGKGCGKESKETTKRPQAAENMGFAIPTGLGQAPTQSHRVEN